MASYMDYAATRGQKVGGMLGQAVDAIRGVEDAEAAVERILKNGDWSTEQGKADMLAKVGAIDPEAHGELQKQLLEAEQTREATSNIKMDTENKLIAHKVKLNKGIYTKDWERLAGAGGMEFEIQYFLAQNEIDFDPKKVRTIAQAKAAIKSHMGKKSNYKSTQGQLDSFLGGRLEIYIGMRATQDAGVELTGGSTTTKQTNKFDVTKVGGDTTGTDTGTTDTEFNPDTANKNITHSGEKDGVLGTWEWVEEVWQGSAGVGGRLIPAGWKFKPNYKGDYTMEGTKYNVDGASITSEEMFNNFDY